MCSKYVNLYSVFDYLLIEQVKIHQSGKGCKDK